MGQVRRRGIDALIFAAGVGAMVWGVAVLSDDVRRQMADVLAGDRSSQVAVVAASVARLSRPVLDTLSAYWSANPWLVGFGVVTLVLFVFIFRA